MKRLVYPLMLAAALSASSCRTFEDAPGGPVGESVPLSLSVTMTQAATKNLITGKSLADGTEIGVSLYDKDGKIYDNLPYSNVRHTAGTQSGKQVWTPEIDVMLSAEKATLYAYYPYSSSVTDLKNIPVEASSEVQTDYLYAEPATGLYNRSAEAAVTMKHALSAVRLNIKRGTYSGKGEVSGFSVKGSGIARTAVLNALTGGISQSAGSSGAINPPVSPFDISADPHSLDIIVIPTDVEAPVEMEVIIDGQSFKIETEALKLSQGIVAVYNATVDNSKVSLSSVSMENWSYDEAGNPVIRHDWNIGLYGNIENISFANSVEDDGSIKIIAVPLMQDAEVNPVEISGGATVRESVDDKTGIRTIILSDIHSDVSVTFNGITLWTTAIYQVDDISSKTAMFKTTFGQNPVTRMKVDGTEVAVATSYQFDSTGEHTVRLAFSPYTESEKVVAQYYLPEVIFSDVTALSEIRVPEGYTLFRNQTFKNCKNLKSVSLPSTLNKIGYGTFYNCSSLKEIDFPDEIEAFYDQVMYGCSSLERVKLPAKLKSMGTSVMNQCKKLKEIELPAGLTSLGSNSFCYSGITRLHLPDGISTLPSQMCMSCSALEEVKLPANLKNISTMAFYSCNNLSRIIHADGSAYELELNLPEGLESIGELVFMYTGFKSIFIPSTLTSIERAGLANESIESLSIHQNNPAYLVKSNALIELSTGILVAGCAGSTIDRSVSIIGPKAFYSCRIPKIDLHEGIMEIQDEAFYTAYTSQIISRALTPAKLGTDSFKIAQLNGTLKVPAEALEAYREQWMLNQAGYLGYSALQWRITTLQEGE